ncbi:MAG: hypothetical protein BYD32DRAFT_11510 [Podila humilis]|nr:MAG: hypothetical protein BYD32DRAFT_11510 [Podila humilis]
MVVTSEVSLLVRCAIRVGNRWLCPFIGCPQVDVSSKDSLRHHLHRFHYGPRERLLCSVNGCIRDFGCYLNLNRHCHQFHMGIGAHV